MQAGNEWAVNIQRDSYASYIRCLLTLQSLRTNPLDENATTSCRKCFYLVAFLQKEKMTKEFASVSVIGIRREKNH
ncbi:unnamed protein product [Arabis nemorensis]|uniref:Uncharacterized protein n=1 Tax=Arabis nemorensis TaxID=586526 RepID=A0A565B129_9BRAS|nr:unnamed protein product [Arabis nemorensis]